MPVTYCCELDFLFLVMYDSIAVVWSVTVNAKSVMVINHDNHEQSVQLCCVGACLSV